MRGLNDICLDHKASKDGSRNARHVKANESSAGIVARWCILGALPVIRMQTGRCIREINNDEEDI